IDGDVAGMHAVENVGAILADERVGGTDLILRAAGEDERSSGNGDVGERIPPAGDRRRSAAFFRKVLEPADQCGVPASGFAIELDVVVIASLSVDPAARAERERIGDDDPVVAEAGTYLAVDRAAQDEPIIAFARVGIAVDRTRV